MRILRESQMISSVRYRCLILPSPAVASSLSFYKRFTFENYYCYYIFGRSGAVPHFDLLHRICLGHPSTMDISYSSLKAARPRIHLIVLFLFGCTQLINLLSYIIYVQNQQKVFGKNGVAAFIVFTCCGILSFFVVSAPLIYWPYAHGNEMSPVARRNMFCLGVIISFLVHDFPMAWIQLWIVTSFGWRDILLSISLFLTLFCFGISFLVTWLSYSWRTSKILQIRFGDAAPSQYGVPAAEIAKRSSSWRYRI